MIARKVAPALAAGCSFVSRPATLTPLSALAMAKLAEEAGLPPGLFAVVTSTAASEAGKEFCENPKVRKLTFTGSTEVGKVLGPDAILASNTSTIPITKLAAGLKRPERFCGIHFFNPVRKMPLVEVIRGEKTSDETVATAVAYAKNIGNRGYFVGGMPLGNALGHNAAAVGEPRTYGMELSFRF